MFKGSNVAAKDQYYLHTHVYLISSNLSILYFGLKAGYYLSTITLLHLQYVAGIKVVAVLTTISPELILRGCCYLISPYCSYAL